MIIVDQGGEDHRRGVVAFGGLVDPRYRFAGEVIGLDIGDGGLAEFDTAELA